MGRPRILDPRIMSKIAKKVGKRDLRVINGMVSRKASKLGVSAEAALIVLAKEHGIGASTYQRKLTPAKQAEVRDALPAIVASQGRSLGSKGNRRLTTPGKSSISRRASLKLVIEYAVQDEELRSRCGDLLLASANFDRAVNQATLVLEDRIRKKAQPTSRLVGDQLVGYAFNEDLSKTRLSMAGGDSDDQRGFTQILRGIVPAFRNRTHHHVVTTFSRDEAMCVCGFIDVLLRVVDSSQKVR